MGMYNLEELQKERIESANWAEIHILKPEIEASKRRYQNASSQKEKDWIIKHVKDVLDNFLKYHLPTSDDMGEAIGHVLIIADYYQNDFCKIAFPKQNRVRNR